MSLITWGRIAGQFKPISAYPRRAWNANSGLNKEQRQAALAAVHDGFSYSHVARAFGCSRSVVAGLVHRAKQAGATFSKAKRRTSPAPRASEPTRPVVAAPVVDGAYQPARVSFLDLRTEHCRWPLWANDAAPSDKLYCGNKVDRGRSYCSHCYGLSYSATFTRDIDRKLNIKHLAGRVS